MIVRRLLIIGGPLLAALTFIAADCGGTTSTPNSGVEGVVTIGPVCPVERIDTPCPDQPYQATIVVKDSNGDEVARTESGEDGRYRVSLAPGTYTLAPQSGSNSGIPHASEQQVEVRADAYTEVDIAFDSGIR